MIRGHKVRPQRRIWTRCVGDTTERKPSHGSPASGTATRSSGPFPTTSATAAPMNRCPSVAGSLANDSPALFGRVWRRLERDRYVRLHRIGPLDPPRGQPLRHQERQLQRLISIQTGVTQRLIAAGQIRLDKIITAADTLGDV